MERRLPHSPAMGSTSYAYADEIEPACLGQPEAYDTMMDLTAGPDYNRAIEQARAICGSCLLQDRCLVENRHEPWVIAMIAGPKPTRTGAGNARQTKARCGTDGGYYKHLRGTKDRAPSKPCDECKEAHRLVQRKWQIEKQRTTCPECGCLILKGETCPKCELDARTEAAA